MKLTTKLTIISLGLTFSLSFVSCKDSEKKVEETVDAIPKDASGIIGLFEKLSSELEEVTDLESAKKAIPAIANAGTMIKKSIEAIGGDEKLEAVILESPKLKARFASAMQTLVGHMQRIKAASPEAYEFIDKKTDASMK